MGYVVLIGKQRIEPAQHCCVQIRLEEPTFALPGDRFIIRQYSPMITIGGGEVLDAFPEKHRRSKKGIVERLAALKAGTTEDRIMLLVHEAGLQTIDLPRLVGRLGITSALGREKLATLAKASRTRILSDNPLTVVEEDAFREAMNRCVAEVKRFHQLHPLVHGISREELKSRVLEDAPLPVFQSLLDRLVADKKLAVAQEIVYEFGRKVTLKADEEQMRTQLLDRFRSLALQVPAPDEVFDTLKMDKSTARKIVQLLIKENALVKVNEELLVHRDTMDKTH